MAHLLFKSVVKLLLDLVKLQVMIMQLSVSFVNNPLHSVARRCLHNADATDISLDRTSSSWMRSTQCKTVLSIKARSLA